MFEKIFKKPKEIDSRSEKSEGFDSESEKRKENANNYREARIYLESKKWDEYMEPLNRKREFLVRSISTFEDAKKEHVMKVDSFNAEIITEIENIKKHIINLSKINSAQTIETRDKLEIIRKKLVKLLIDENERNKYGYDINSKVENESISTEEIKVSEERVISEKEIEEYIEKIQEQTSWYKESYLNGVLYPMEKRYYSEEDTRLKELLRDELDRTKKDIVSEIDEYQNSFPEIEDFSFSAALAELHEIKNEITVLGTDSNRGEDLSAKVA